MHVYANIFAGVEVAGIFLHGGRDMSGVEGGIDNNLFYRMPLAVRLSGSHVCYGDNATLYRNLAAMPHQSPLWRARYPFLANLTADAPCEPRNNAVGVKAPNAAVAVGPTNRYEAEHGWWANVSNPAYGDQWLSLPIYPDAPGGDAFAETEFDIGAGVNWAGADPGWAAGSAADPLMTLNFTLAADSPLWARGWMRIPEEDIGFWARGLLP